MIPTNLTYRTSLNYKTLLISSNFLPLEKGHAKYSEIVRVCAFKDRKSEIQLYAIGFSERRGHRDLDPPPYFLRRTSTEVGSVHTYAICIYITRHNFVKLNIGMLIYLSI